MTDFEKLKQELAIQYPELSNSELHQMTHDFIRFFKIATRIVTVPNPANDNFSTSAAISSSKNSLTT